MCIKIGQIYFKIGVVEKPVNPFASIMQSMMSGGGGPGRVQGQLESNVDFD